MTDHDCLIVAGCMQLSELQSKGDIYNSLNKTEAGGQQQDITRYLKANMNRSKKLCPIKSEKHLADQVWSQNISGHPALIDLFAAVVWFFLECIKCSFVSIQVIQVRGTPKSGCGMLWHVVACCGMLWPQEHVHSSTKISASSPGDHFVVLVVGQCASGKKRIVISVF